MSGLRPTDGRVHAPLRHGLWIVALAALFSVLLVVLAYLTLFALVALGWFGFVVPFGAVLLVVALVDGALSSKRCRRCGERLRPTAEESTKPTEPTGRH
ncbi:Na+/proline symporter [Streptacidiphilus sp. BW17]|uniref:hypothetical protein n=1 Tax=Streptacidiphilus sp. BW17 TaxID=3156274 RepID=UPI00351920E5